MSQRAQVSVLEHRGHGPTHWDLLFASGRRCLTWSFYPRSRGLAMVAQQRLFTYQCLPAHRRFYLDYSGPVAASRGRTRCLWRGVMVLHKEGAGYKLINNELSISLGADGLARWQVQDRLQPWLESNWVVLTTPQPQRS